MKVNTAIAALGGSLFIAAGANAAFSSIGWQEVDSMGLDGITRTIDVYAEFDSSLDELNAVAGTVLNTANINVVGGSFYINGFGGAGAGTPNPALFGAFPSVEFDTFFSIGALVSTNDETGYTPGFPAISGSAWSSSNAVWSVTPGTAQGIAGNSVLGSNRVLIARLSGVAAGPGTVEFNGNFSIQGFADGSLLSADVEFDTASVPAPGALALLGLAGLAGTRRRRA